MARRDTPTTNLAARMGRWSAGHWKTATFGWLAFVAVAFALGGMVGTTIIDTSKPGPGESGRMDSILDAGFEQPAGESVLIQARSRQIGSSALDSTVDDVIARVSKVEPVVTLLTTTVAPGITPPAVSWTTPVIADVAPPCP